MPKYTSKPAVEIGSAGNCWRSKIEVVDGVAGLRAGYAYGPTPEAAEALALQFAAASDLLEALKAFEALGWREDQLDPAETRVYHQIRAAIAAAEGVNHG